jgi:hypothetical protein
VQTNLDIEDGLFLELERKARQQGKPLVALLEQALREVVGDPPAQSPVAPGEGRR